MESWSGSSFLKDQSSSQVQEQKGVGNQVIRQYLLTVYSVLSSKVLKWEQGTLSPLSRSLHFSEGRKKEMPKSHCLVK